jgi:crossover junction endodeoxyribonuclease RuvC
MAGCCGVVHSDGWVDTWQLSHKGDDPKSLRLNRLYSNLVSAWHNHPYQYIGAEESAFGSPNGRVKAMHNELLGVLKLVGNMLDCPVYLYKPTQIKKFATGNGRAEKSDVVAACREKLGIDTDSDDVADAAWVLAMLKQEVW